MAVPATAPARRPFQDPPMRLLIAALLLAGTPAAAQTQSETMTATNPLPAPPPVDMVINPDPNATSRQQIEQKTAPETCAACHTLINPLGFLFENYDAIGRYRTTDNGLPVDASGAISKTDVDGELVGAVALAEALASSETVTSCVSRQWLRFALGRDDGALDSESIALASERAYAQGGDLRELIVGLTVSDAFRHRRVPKAQ